MPLFFGTSPDILCWLYSELYFRRFHTDKLKNRTQIEKVFVGDRPFFALFGTPAQIFVRSARKVGLYNLSYICSLLRLAIFTELRPNSGSPSTRNASTVAESALQNT